MILTSFFGGQDVQRSLNMSDNKCVNLIPTTNDKGDVAGFITTPGLSNYANTTNVSSGIYTASNGRCFCVSGTVFNEITTGGVLINRGTVTTADISRMSDNGIELIIVNGVDGWLFTFATNVLKNIKIATGQVSITIASPAVLTCNNHGLVAGDRVLLTSGTTLPAPFDINTSYYVIAAGLTTNNFELSLTLGGAAINTGGIGGTFTIYGGFYPECYISPLQTMVAGTPVTLTTTGTLPNPLALATTYYLKPNATYPTWIFTLYTDAAMTLPSSNGIGLYGGVGTHTVTGSAPGTGGPNYFETAGYGFPAGSKTVSYMDGRFICSEPNTQNFFVSDVLDGGKWDALNVQTADSNPDLIVGQTVSHNELIVFCEQSGEVYYDAGTYPTPFVRNASGIFEVGCVAPYSIAKIDNSVMWLGRSSTGQGIIYRLEGYRPIRMSTYSIEYAIQTMTDITDARAFTYQQEGHHFYVISFPTGNRTFVYDINMQMWHERASWSNGVFSRWEAQEYAYFDHKHLVCDYESGQIYSLDMQVFTDGGLTRKWVRSFKSIPSDMKRVPHHKLTLELETGVGLNNATDNTIEIKYSDDGGHTWSSERTASMGLIGEYQKRAFWHRFGITKGKPRVYEISGTSPVKTMLLNCYLE